MNGKCEAHFLEKKNPRKYHWTVFYRRLHKKGAAEEVAKKRVRKTAKVQRAIVGATWEQIVAKREQPEAVRKATRDAAAEAAKQKKKAEEAKKKAEKIKVQTGCSYCLTLSVEFRKGSSEATVQGCQACQYWSPFCHEPLNLFNKFSKSLCGGGVCFHPV